MSVLSAIVLLAVVWFMVLFVVLPIRLETQGDTGESVDGTHAGSPASSFSMRRKLKVTTFWALLAWALIASVMLWGGITVRDIDVFGRMGPSAAPAGRNARPSFPVPGSRPDCGRGRIRRESGGMTGHCRLTGVSRIRPSKGDYILDVSCSAFACLAAGKPIRREKSVTGKFVAAVQPTDNERK